MCDIIVYKMSAFLQVLCVNQCAYKGYIAGFDFYILSLQEASVDIWPEWKFL